MVDLIRQHWEVGGVDAVKNWSLYQKADFLKNKGMKNGLRIDGRLSRAVDPLIGSALLTAIIGRYEDGSDMRLATEIMNSIFNELKLPFYREYDADVAAILD
jgi:glycogen debranching enzyme